MTVTGAATPAATAVEAFLHHLTVERGSAANTLRSYAGDLDRYLAHLRGRGLDDLAAVREDDVTSFVVALRSGPAPLAASSAARALAAVRGLHRFAVHDGLVGEDVARAVTPPALPKRLPKALSIDQVEQLLAGCPGDGPGALRDRALLELLYSTGARISEAVGLDVDDLDPRQRTVLLRGKGGKQRIVPVGRPALAAVDAYAVRARPGLAARGRGTPALLLNARGGAAVPAERLARAAAGRRDGRAGHRGVAAHAAALLRDPPAGRRGRRAGGAGAARARLGEHDADLHPGHGGHAARGVRDLTPAGPGLSRTYPGHPAPGHATGTGYRHALIDDNW